MNVTGEVLRPLRVTKLRYPVPSCFDRRGTGSAFHGDGTQPQNRRLHKLAAARTEYMI